MEKQENFGSYWSRHVHKTWKMQVKTSPESSDASWKRQLFYRAWFIGLVLPLACTGSSWQCYMSVTSFSLPLKWGELLGIFSKSTETCQWINSAFADTSDMKDS